MEAFIEIGRCIVIETCLLLVFILLASLSMIKFGLIFKIAKPVFGFLIGMCVGAYLFNFFSGEAARIGALVFGIGGAFAALSMGNSSQKI